MSGTLVLCSRQEACRVNQRLLRQITIALLRDLLCIENFELGISLVSSSEITRLNATFLRHRGPTDVIAFDYADAAGQASRLSADSRDACRIFLHGEIFICPDEALTQARRFHTTWQSELIRYLIHGLLHLLGYDDSRHAMRRKMKRQEDHLLRDVARHFDLKRLGLQNEQIARFT